MDPPPQPIDKIKMANRKTNAQKGENRMKTPRLNVSDTALGCYWVDSNFKQPHARSQAKLPIFILGSAFADRSNHARGTKVMSQIDYPF
jgi:hypothetical protein